MDFTTRHKLNDSIGFYDFDMTQEWEAADCAAHLLLWSETVEKAQRLLERWAALFDAAGEMEDKKNDPENNVAWCSLVAELKRNAIAWAPEFELAVDKGDK